MQEKIEDCDNVVCIKIWINKKQLVRLPYYDTITTLFCSTN